VVAAAVIVAAVAIDVAAVEDPITMAMAITRIGTNHTGARLEAGAVAVAVLFLSPIP
jgi:hypothetical protein